MIGYSYNCIAIAMGFNMPSQCFAARGAPLCFDVPISVVLILIALVQHRNQADSRKVDPSRSCAPELGLRLHTYVSQTGIG